MTTSCSNLTTNGAIFSYHSNERLSTRHRDNTTIQRRTYVNTRTVGVGLRLILTIT